MKLDKLASITIDPTMEVRKIIASGGHDRAPTGHDSLNSVYHTFIDLRTLGFFGLVAEQYGNSEAPGERSQRTYDIFEADTIDGHIFFITVITHEALDLFLDDGLVLSKIRDWLIASVRKICAAEDTSDPAALWDVTLSGSGSPLPRNVRVIPFYQRDLVRGVPGVILVLVGGAN
ncbi:MAG TPA: hypothetical protein VK436_10950 [Methanocella sp.]|nr:hypothetical protein [Methanocella sp.]